jgi:flagellar motor component MotA
MLCQSAGRRLIKEGRIKQNDYIRYHVNLIANARKNGYNKLEADSKLSDLEVLAEIQHYGGATCLTDFSTNFLVATLVCFAKADTKNNHTQKGTGLHI